VATGGTPTADYGSSPYAFNIGGGGILDPAGNFFRGQLDEIALYDRELDAAKVCLLYQTALGRPLVLKAQRAGADLILTWPCGTLESADQIGGSWSEVTGASPLLVTPQNQQKFYRIRL